MNATINRDTTAIIAAVEEILVGGSRDTVPTADAMSFYAALPAYGNGDRANGTGGGVC